MCDSICLLPRSVDQCFTTKWPQTHKYAFSSIYALMLYFWTLHVCYSSLQSWHLLWLYQLCLVWIGPPAWTLHLHSTYFFHMLLCIRSRIRIVASWKPGNVEYFFTVNEETPLELVVWIAAGWESSEIYDQGSLFCSCHELRFHSHCITCLIPKSASFLIEGMNYNSRGHQSANLRRLLIIIRETSKDAFRESELGPLLNYPT